jgi:predicted dienelactone hydrolase
LNQALRRVALLCVCVSPLGCIGMLGRANDPPTSVGTHPVGVTTITVRDPSRDRELDVEVWYPAARVENGEPFVYRIEAGGVTVAQLRSVSGAHRNVAAWREGGPLPVVLMSHGSGSTRFGNVSLSEVLASHGYIVAAPDHVGHTMGDHVLGIDNDERYQSAYDRPLDLSRVLDDLERRSSKRKSWLHGLVDPTRVAVAGHSFGGATALGIVGARFDGKRQAKECRLDADDRRCHALPLFGDKSYRYRDARVKAAVLITPGGYDFYRADGVALVDAPTLIVGARRDKSNPFGEYVRPVYDALRSPSYLLDLRQAGHLTPTDVCDMVDSIGFLAKAFGGAQSKDGCGSDYMTGRDALDRVTMATIPFLAFHLNGDREAREQLELALAPPEPRRQIRRPVRVARSKPQSKGTGTTTLR